MLEYLAYRSLECNTEIPIQVDADEVGQELCRTAGEAWARSLSSLVGLLGLYILVVLSIAMMIVEGSFVPQADPQILVILIRDEGLDPQAQETGRGLCFVLTAPGEIDFLMRTET